MGETRCRLAALGMINCLGRDTGEIWSRLLDGDQSGFVRRADLVPGRDLLVGAVEGELPKVPAHLQRYECRNNAFTLAALEQIAEDVAAVVERFGPARVGVVMGTSTSGSAECEEALRYESSHGQLLARFQYPQLELGGTSGFLAAYLGLTGPAFTLSTACSSSARSLASARSLLSLGVCDAVLAGGSDSLCGLTTNGFAALQAVAEDVSNPFSVNRSGLTLGEGAALFLVTREETGVQLLGVGESSEAHHMSAPDPEGDGAADSMRGALRDAGIAPSEIAYLNLHGTGTRLNDVMESLAVARVLGTETPCSSTKSLVGHTLGAAGAMEVGFCWMVLRARDGAQLPLIPHCYDGMRDPDLEPISLVHEGERCEVARDAFVLSNSFGFGGNNCSLVLGTQGAQ